MNSNMIQKFCLVIPLLELNKEIGTENYLNSSKILEHEYFPPC